MELYSKQWAWDKLDKFFGWTARNQENEGMGSIAQAIKEAEARLKRMEAEDLERQSCGEHKMEQRYDLN